MGLGILKTLECHRPFASSQDIRRVDTLPLHGGACRHYSCLIHDALAGVQQQRLELLPFAVRQSLFLIIQLTSFAAARLAAGWEALHVAVIGRYWRVPEGFRLVFQVGATGG